MKVKIIEKSDDKIKVEIDDLTLVNLLNENVWHQKGISAYSREHPYLSKPVLMVRGKNPEKMILDAAEEIIKDCKELQNQLKRQ